MAIQIGDFLLVPDHELEHFRTYDELRRFLQESLQDDLSGIERFLKELRGGNVTAVRLRPSAGNRGHIKTTPLPSGIPLREMSLPPRAPRARPPVPPPPVETPWFEITVLTDDGVPIPNVTFEIADGWGFTTSAATDDNGHLRVDTNLEATHEIRVANTPITLPPPPLEPAKTSGFALRRDVADPLTLGSNKAHTLVVARPRATVCSIDGWWENQKVLVFQSARDSDDGVVTVRGILRQALCTPAKGEVHIVGHADTKGGAADNDELAMTRAKSVYLYLAGKRKEWAEHAFANADVATLQAALYWISLNSVVECDPGPVDGDWGPVTSFGLTMLRLESGILPGAPLGVDDWCAIYDRFDEGLAALLLTDAAGLAQARSRIQAIEPSSKGERFPIENPESNGQLNAANRRVDVVFCAPGAIPAPDSDEVYDGTFSLTHVNVSPEIPVQIIATDPNFKPIPFARVLVEVGAVGRRWLTADITATVRFTALKTDRMRMLRGTEPGGSGTMTTNGLQEAVLAAQAAVGDLL